MIHRTETPATLKFAYPIVLLPELFTTIDHLSLLSGYLTSIGWEVHAIDPYASESASGWNGLLEAVRIAINARASKVIVAGHGLGGLIALEMAQQAEVIAAVAFAPMLPGFVSPLIAGARNRFARWLGASLHPPSGRKLFELIADADPFHREAIIKNLRPADAQIARELVRGKVFVNRDSEKPRLIIAGESDIFAPYDRTVKFAELIGAQLATIRGPGHWLIGGRALERAVHEMQRFLVKRLGRELLLLYPEDPAEN